MAFLKYDKAIPVYGAVRRSPFRRHTRERPANKSQVEISDF